MNKVLLCISFVLAMVAAANADCIFTDSSNNKYDFSSMTNSTQYSWGTNLGGAKYYWNICKNSFICSQSSTGLQATTAACQLSSSIYNSLGLLSSGVFGSLPSGAKGATLTYTDSVLTCASKTKARKALIDLQCVPGASTQTVSVAENPPGSCIYQIVMTSGQACPGAGGSSSSSSSGGNNGGNHGIGGGWIFIIILVCTATVYIAAGMIINFKVRGLQGKEMFPNYGFWSDLPGLMKDGVFFVKGKITGTSGGTSGYQQV
ncbi:hypothetical protein SAMD00019534_036920, partial [Acytostelium subglobosum LB1]|uniref:hypothetical protein n=1 Tax=Acytostelium subglobosum LB1 TaxID=1410327 RepID=UPI000645118A